MSIEKFVLNETSYFGFGAREVLPEEIKNRGYKKVLVVTDKSLFEIGLTKKVILKEIFYFTLFYFIFLYLSTSSL